MLHISSCYIYVALYIYISYNIVFFKKHMQSYNHIYIVYSYWYLYIMHMLCANDNEIKKTICWSTGSCPQRFEDIQPRFLQKPLRSPFPTPAIVPGQRCQEHFRVPLGRKSCGTSSVRECQWQKSPFNHLDPCGRKRTPGDPVIGDPIHQFIQNYIYNCSHSN